jgi:serine/threonine protein kinase
VKKPTAFGKYFLLERISVGGMAEVFRSKAFGVEGFERLVAVKRILPSVAEDKEFIRMFIEEAKLAVQLNHANIAQIFDLGVVDGSYYIALEHVHGRDLGGIFERCRELSEAMPIAQACFIAMKVCEGLDYAHNKRDQGGRPLQLIHRDVSPHNILVSFEGEVKLIDFGVAKAAGAGPRTMAGILKGKFGYMSPEQAHGVHLDRRSDVFSCGVVLYELLTGERLFAADSDYATAEKVKNVEILPPSTYNRKIPDELERIVLKALSKDVDERYQNAIDLHDELQAFVYTAGEFYSRKDLAGWMKRTFGKEIEEETAKLESYRQLKPPIPGPASPPPVPAAAVSSAQSGAVQAAASSVPSGGHSSASAGGLSGASPAAPSAVPPALPAVGPAMGPAPSMLAAGSLDPLPMMASTGPIAATSEVPAPVSDAVPEPIPAVSRVSTGNRAARKPPTQPAPLKAPPPPPGRSQPIPAHAASAPDKEATVPRARGRLRPNDPGWDDDDIETRLYDEEAKHKSKRTALPLQPPVSSSPGIALTPPEPAPRGAPDLSALARSPRSWDPLVSTDSFPEVMIQRNHTDPSAQNGAGSPPQFPTGSSDAPSPVRRDPAPDRAIDRPLDRAVDRPLDRGIDRPLDRAGRDAAPVPAARERSTAHRAPAARPGGEVPYDPMAAFGARFAAARRGPDRRSVLTIVLGSATVAAVAVIAVILLSSSSQPVPQPAPAPVVKPPPPPPAADPNTGFDLYVTPPGMTQWKLDGESRTDRLPSRIRGIAAGTHTVQIDPPPGFMSQFQKVTVELGQAPKVEIVLQPIPGLTGVFESAPPGATVSLITDGKRRPIGPSPARAPLDPRSTHQVLFEKPGYVSVNRPIAFTGVAEERIAVTLEKAAADKPPAPPAPEPRLQRRAAPPISPKPVDKPPAPVETSPDRAAPEPADPLGRGADASAKGILVLGSKPPCEILIDGNATGLHTPQTEIKLSPGRHKITLVNSEFGIKESFNVDIKLDAPEKVIKDYSDRLPSQ